MDSIITFEDFTKVDLRVGTIIEVNDFPEARNPAYQLTIDFGEILTEGNSLILTLVKNISNDENRFKRINVQKIASLKDLFNSPIQDITFDINSIDHIEKISKFLNKEGHTVVNLNLKDEKNYFHFQLKNKRDLDRKSINLLRNKQIIAQIN